MDITGSNNLSWGDLYFTSISLMMHLIISFYWSYQVRKKTQRKGNQNLLSRNFWKNSIWRKHEICYLNNRLLSYVFSLQSIRFRLPTYDLLVHSLSLSIKNKFVFWWTELLSSAQLCMYQCFEKYTLHANKNVLIL